MCEVSRESSFGLDWPLAFSLKEEYTRAKSSSSRGRGETIGSGVIGFGTSAGPPSAGSFGVSPESSLDSGVIGFGTSALKTSESEHKKIIRC